MRDVKVLKASRFEVFVIGFQLTLSVCALTRGKLDSIVPSHNVSRLRGVLCGWGRSICIQCMICLCDLLSSFVCSGMHA